MLDYVRDGVQIQLWLGGRAELDPISYFEFVSPEHCPVGRYMQLLQPMTAAGEYAALVEV
jgi:hypothetical protein